MKVSTMVASDVATKLISNFVKGNPHFKPWLGVHGKSSWFLESGTPYTGVDLTKNIEIYAEIDDTHVKTDNNLTKNMFETINHENPNMARAARDLLVWDTIGEVCAARTYATHLYVPKGDLSRQGSGYFLVLPHSISKHLKIDFEKSAPNIKNYDQLLKHETEREAEKNNAAAPALTIWIGPLSSNDACKQKLKSIRHSFGTPQKEEGRAVEKNVNIKSGWSGHASKTGYFSVTTLHYLNYREARKALREILTTIRGDVKALCIAGEDWKQKSKKINTFFGELSASSTGVRDDIVWADL
ncbi:hypothetical protein ACPA1H_17200 [Ectopseudomonas chengduensis]